MSKWGKSPVVTLIELSLDGLLLLCFIIQAFLLGCLFAYGHIPLPANWLSPKITGQLPSGLRIEAENYALQLDGSIRIRNLELHLEGIEGAIFLADDVYARFDIHWNKQAPVSLRECVLLNGLLNLPAVYSPDGSGRPILEKTALRLLPTPNGLRIDSFATRHDNIHLRGSIDWTGSEQATTPIHVRERADQVFKQLAQLLKQREKIDGFEQPSVFLKIDLIEDQALQVETRVSSRSYQHSALQAKNLRLEARLELKDQALLNSSSVWLRADELELPAYQARASGIRAQLDQEEWGALLAGEWPDMEVITENLVIRDLSLKTSRLRLKSRAFPELEFNGLTSGLKGAVEFSGSLNLEMRAAQVQADGNLDLLSILPEAVEERLPHISFKQAPHFNLNLDFAENFALNTARLSAHVDALKIDDITFDHIRLRGSYQQGFFSTEHCYLRRGWQWLDLGFQLDTKSQDYTLTLKGFAKPDDYNAILPRWWEGIFRDFDFSSVESGLGDFVIYGNTEEKATGFFFGHASAQSVGYKGVQIDRGELFVRGQGPYAEVHRLDARSGEGYVRGDIRFASRLDEVRGPMSVRLDLDTQLPLEDAKKLFNEDIALILDDFKTETLPRTQLRGAIFNTAYPEFAGLSWIDLTADCPAPLSYKGLPLERLRFALMGRPDITYLREIELGYAGGSARAEADILAGGEGPAEARFRLTLKDADPKLAIARLRTLQDPTTPSQVDENTAGEARLDLALHARAPIDDLTALHGYGNFLIEDEALYAIQVFGPLSEILQNTRLGFTSFALDEMVGQFALKEKSILFDPIEINGPRSRIEARGAMGLNDYTLAMRVSVFLFGNAGNPESRLRKITDFISRPIPNVLEFELSGTPEDQKWRSRYDPRNYLPLPDYKDFLPDYRNFIPQF
ncbi:MAG: hypothetical protein ACNA77_06875 [Opitutales bacterium]